MYSRHIRTPAAVWNLGISLFRAIAPKPIRRVGREILYALKRRRWGKRWAQRTESFHWETLTIPREIEEAVSSGWFPAGASALDIGCGSGEIAAWLAQRGFRVLGIDYAMAAIERAESEHGQLLGGKLTFKRMDVCRDPLSPSQFGVLLDRGCLHNIPVAFRADYVRNIGTAAVPGAHFMLLFGLFDPGADKLPYLEALFSPMFEIVEAKETRLTNGSANCPSVPGVVLWMVRREPSIQQ